VPQHRRASRRRQQQVAAAPAGQRHATARPRTSGSGAGRPVDRENRTVTRASSSPSSQSTPVTGCGSRRRVPATTAPRGCSARARRTAATAPNTAPSAAPSVRLARTSTWSGGVMERPCRTDPVRAPGSPCRCTAGSAAGAPPGRLPMRRRVGCRCTAGSAADAPQGRRERRSPGVRDPPLPARVRAGRRVATVQA
jgi:hypothetical protein